MEDVPKILLTSWGWCEHGTTGARPYLRHSKGQQAVLWDNMAAGKVRDGGGGQSGEELAREGGNRGQCA